MTAAPITVLIADDEHLARERLRVLLDGEPDIEIVGECKNGLQALGSLTRTHPDLVFLDMQMPDLDGLGVLAALTEDETPEVIFVTAYNSYMEQAFEVHAADYLRKPYTNARFTKALAHARRRVRERISESAAGGTPDERSGTIRSRYTPVLAALEAVHFDPRIAVLDSETGIWQIVDRDDIDWIQADGSARVRVHVRGHTYSWRKTLSELEHTLDPRAFLRIHRSYIVNIARITQVKPLQRGEYAVILDDDAMFDSGRTYRDTIERFLELRT